MSETDERNRRWTLALGVDPDAESGFTLSDSDRRMSDALTALYGAGTRRRRAEAASADRRRASRDGWATSANFSPHPWCR